MCSAISHFGLSEAWLSSETHARIGLRAYVHASAISITSELAKVTLKNVGQTPAHNIRTWRRIYHCPRANRRPETERNWTEQKMSIARDEVIYLDRDVPALSADAVKRIAAGDKAIILFNGGVNTLTCSATLGRPNTAFTLLRMTWKAAT